MQCVGCTRSSGHIELFAAFSDDTVVGELSAAWVDDGATRPTTGSSQVERQVQVRVDASNRLADRLYVGFQNFRLATADGRSIDVGGAACALAPNATRRVLTGTVWVPGSAAANAVRSFRVEPVAVPLSERGRAFYREFLLAQRPEATEAIDRTIAAYASAPPCGAAD